MLAALTISMGPLLEAHRIGRREPPINNLFSGNIYGIGKCPHLKGSLGAVPYHVLRLIIPVSGLTDTADINQVLLLRVQCDAAFL